MAREFSRLDRIADLIRRELAFLIQKEIQDPRIGLITILAVTLSKDLAHARVYVSILSPDQVAETLQGLNKAAGFLRGLLAKRLKMRVVPALRFLYDDTPLKAERIAKLIDSALAEKKRIS